MAAETNLKEILVHRDLSWLSFNERVMEEALDSENPLLERLRFFAIFVNNLDEFNMVRVSGVKKLVDTGYNRKDGFGYYPPELFAEIKAKAEALVKKLYEAYENKTKKELEKNKIFLKLYADLNPEQKKYAKKYFDSTVFPIITPMAVDQGHPFPILPSKTLALAVSLIRQEKPHLAVIPLPQNVSRVLRVPSEKDEFSFVLLEEIIKENLKNFFKGYQVQCSSLFRVIRDSELAIEEEFTPDLLKAMENELKKRSKAPAVYFEIEKTCTTELLDVLCQAVGFPAEDVVLIPGDMDLTYLNELVRQTEKPELLFKSYVPRQLAYENIFDKINEGDFITHLPYESFHPVVDLIQTAATDPGVLAIKMTLYRTNEDSAIVQALKQAAKNKKQVTVLVEIKARFDEEKNIIWAKELEQSGCHVIYGIAGLKIHSKMTLVVRKEEGIIRRYVHLSTGNYNEKTAKIYTDVGYFTSNDDFARDISEVFNVITGYSVPSPWKRIVSSPTDLRQYFFELIDKEIEFQKKYKNGMIWAKFNSLEDPRMVEKLYQASKAGVKIRLVVRGMCVLVPGVAGLSENIEVHSIIGRFLEHSRIYWFNNNGTPRIFLSSSDWMSRNLDRRIELLFEIYKTEIKEHLQMILETCWKDNKKARILQADRTYVRYQNNEPKFSSQEYFLSLYAK